MGRAAAPAIRAVMTPSTAITMSASRREPIVEATLNRLVKAKAALAKAEERLSEVSDALIAADCCFQDDYLDHITKETGKTRAEAVEMLRSIEPRLQEMHAERLAQEVAAVQDYQRWQAETDTVNKRHTAELKVLHKRITELEMQDSHAVSYPKYFAEKHKQQRVMLDWTLDTSRFDPLPSCLSDPDTGPEKETVQPFWRELLRTNGNELFSGLSSGFEVGYLGPKVPDIAAYAVGVAKPRPAHFATFGDCKGNTWTGTSTAELGQAMHYAHRILDAQPLRSHVYGFFTNNDIVVLCKGWRQQRKPFAVFWDITAPMTFQEGMKAYFHFMKHESGFVPPPTVSGSTLNIERTLRSGGSCRAFVASFSGSTVVAKLYNDEEAATQEVTNLRKVPTDVGDDVARIPTIEATEGCWVLVSPVGSPFTATSFRLDHLKQVIQRLKSAHDAGIIHRDVRFSNMLVLEDGNALLIDWGSAAAVGEPVPVAGCPAQFRHPELREGELVAPLPKHDLFSFVAATAALLMPGIARHAYGTIFGRAFQAADDANYDECVRALQSAGVHSD